MNLLQTFLFVCASLLLINFIFSAVCFYSYRDRLYRYSLLLWFASAATAVLEGIFDTGNLPMVLSYSSYFICSLTLVKILGIATGEAFPFRGYGLLMILGLLGTGVANLLGAGFLFTALPASIGVTFPMFHAAIRYFRKYRATSSARGASLYCGLLLLNGAHFLDYPFLRLEPRFVLLGFLLALGVLMAFSVFLPSFIIQNINDRHARTVSDLNRKLVEYQEQMSELISLAQVGELSFGFVHDMASPTTILLHYSKQISDLHKDPTRKEERIRACSRGIEQATVRLMRLQKLFRTMLKKESGYEPAPLDLRECIRESAELFGQFLERHGISLETHYNLGSVSSSSEGATVVILPGVMERVLMNLIQNAANALMESRERKIEITLDSSADSSTVTVRDTGPGISPDRLTRLWERFGPSETVKSTGGGFSGARSGGSGFGLYKVKQLIDSVHGRIEVESSPRGTVFRVTVPNRPIEGGLSAPAYAV